MCKSSFTSRLLCSTALVALVGTVCSAQPALSEPSCLPTEDCADPAAGTVVSMPAPPGTLSTGTETVAPTGFEILIDGQSVAADPKVQEVTRQIDVALEQADIQVRFDGLGAVPRLDIQRSAPDRGLEAGETVTFTGRMNYPAYADRAEIRLFDRAPRLGSDKLQIIPMAPNGQTTITVPTGRDIVAVLRVYDAQGRYDETQEIALSRPDDRGQAEGVEEGSDNTARRAIPIRGGAVTVSGKNIAPGGAVRTLGEDLTASSDGSFVLQRILPAGKHQVDVQVSGIDQQLHVSRDIAIPRHDLFYTALADATLGVNEGGKGRETYSRGRLAFYANGYNDRGYELTAAADTRDNDIRDLFKSFDEKDPSSLLRRIDPNEYYPTYGDGSTMVEDAPTQGKVYLRVEREGSYFIWGNSQAQLDNTEYLRNERTLYGANGHWQSREQTSFGEPRSQVTLYAARPDNLPQRDVLRGTGGSLYFLSRQDISRGSEVVTVEVRDETTGRVLERRRLLPGTDYEVNYLQGSIQLVRPLSASSGGGVVVTSPGGPGQVNLVVQYEYTPVTGTVDGSSLGGRAETWVGDKVRLGVSGQKEETGTADQTAYGADLRYRLGENSHIGVEYAKSHGPGFGFRSSTDGGLIFDSTAPVDGNGHAIRAEADLDLAEIGAGYDGNFSGYYERRTAGFTSLDYTSTTAEELWGFSALVQATPQLAWRVYNDDFRNAAGRRESEGGIEAIWRSSDRNEWAVGAEHVRRDRLEDVGDRTDVALRYTRHQSSDFSWSLLAQTTVAHAGLERNDRVGAGIARTFRNGWTLAGEVSDGTLGFGADMRASYERADHSTIYFGYELDPDAFDIQRSGTTLTDNRGRFVSGGTRRVNSAVNIIGENTYDIFSDRNTLTSSYGVEYAPQDNVAYTVALDVGKISDVRSGDFTRHAVSLGAEYEDATLRATGRVEYRRERGEASAQNRNADTILMTGVAAWKLDDSRQLLGSVDYADTNTDETSIRDGELTDVVLGYAIRPVNNDKFNLLTKYRYYHDMYGQTVDGTDNRGPRQKSHVFTIDAEYDLDRNWSIGGKVGGRLTRSAATRNNEFYRNDAYLVVVNTRYHVVHNWDMLLEARALHLMQAKTTEYGVLGAAYRHFGNNIEIGVGYNFGNFSDDLVDLTRDDRGVFVNAIAKF